MSACVAYGCTNRISKRIPGITFHRFPSNETLKKAWILAIKRKNWHPTPHSRICSVHFSEDLLNRSLSKVFVRENAIPTIFPGCPTYEKSTENEKDSDVSSENSIFSDILNPLSDDNSASTEESPFQPWDTNTLSDESNAPQLQPSDEGSESEENTNILSGINVITFCDKSKQSSSPCNPSPFVAKVVNILNSSPSPAAVVQPPSSMESLQLIQNIFSHSRIKEEQAKELVRRDIRRNSRFTDTYCRKIKLIKKMVAVQEKKVEALKRVTSSLKRERVIE